MRTVSTNFQNALNLNNPKFFLLGKIEFEDTNLFLSSINYTLTFNGDTYPKSSSIVSFGAPKVSSSVDREIYELVINDQSNLLQEKLRIGAIGALVSVYAGFFDSSGAPMLDLADCILAYQGTIDSGAVVASSENKLCKIQASSPMGNLDAIGAYMVSRDGMMQVDDTDTSFNEVIAGSKEINLKWGKI